MKRPARTPFSFKGLSLLLAAVLLPAGYAALTPTPVLAARLWSAEPCRRPPLFFYGVIR